MTIIDATINVLEQQILTAETDADEKLWQQAACVVAQLDVGLTQRDLAAQWINLRTGRPYNAAHVCRVRKVHRLAYTQQPRPAFRRLYNMVANKAKTRPAAPPYALPPVDETDPQIKALADRQLTTRKRIERPTRYVARLSEDMATRASCGTFTAAEWATVDLTFAADWLRDLHAGERLLRQLRRELEGELRRRQGLPVNAPRLALMS